MIPEPTPPPGYRVKSAKVIQDDCRVSEDAIVTETRWSYEYESIDCSLRRSLAAAGLWSAGVLLGFLLGWMFWGR